MGSMFNYCEPSERKARKSWWKGEQRWGCTAAVHNGGGSVGFHSCGKAAKHDPDPDGNPTRCGIHSNEAIKRRKEKSDAYYKDLFQKMDEKAARRERQRQKLADAVAIVEAIAEGHNDPRSACQAWVNKYGEDE